MGSSKKSTVSWWYHPTFQLALHQGPFDKLLRIRGGDVDAWQGEITASGSITVNGRNIWGGEEKEGGIEGTFDVMFGEMDSQPNAYIQGAVGPDPSGHNGVALLQFNGGRYGAGNPYPKRISALTERIYEGWLDDQCWYPETAQVPSDDDGPALLPAALLVTGSAKTTGGPVFATSNASAVPEFVGIPTSTGADLVAGKPAWGDGRWVVHGDHTARVALSVNAWTTISSPLNGLAAPHLGPDGWIVMGHEGGTVYDRVAIADFELTGFALWRFVAERPPGTTLLTHGEEAYMATADGQGYWMDIGGRGILASAATLGGTPVQAVYNRTDGIIAFHHVMRWKGAVYAACTWDFGQNRPQLRRSWDGGHTFPDVLIDQPSGGLRPFELLDGGDVLFVLSSQSQYLWSSVDNFATARATELLRSTHARGRQMAFTGGRCFVVGLTGVAEGDGGCRSTVDGTSFASIATLPIGSPQGIAASPAPPVVPTGYMNAAHVIYDSLVFLQEEPVASINDANFRAAADRLYSEGFGICTRFNHDRDNVEQFRRRILDLIGAECSRDPVTGLWHLDLIRGVAANEIDGLLVLTDDDILDYQDDPTTLDDAVNQVSVKWFDPDTKQERITAPVHSLGLVNAMGRINAETKAYPEVPRESLANRLCARDLHNKATPTWRQQLTTNRKPYRLRIGQYFRLQAPKRGIADMICLLADRDKGTLQSGAIKLLAVQDVFSMPDTTYVVGQPPELPPSTVPVPVAQQRAFEAPYVELAGVLSAGDLAALDADAAYLLAVGVRPGIGHEFALLSRIEGGEFDRIGIFDWCPSATVVEGAGHIGNAFTLTGGSNLSRVELGTAALWGDELVRVDSLDLETGAVTLGRACGDTVPAVHAAGSRIFFYDAWAASDQAEYATAETAEAKLLTRTGTAELAEADADLLSVTFDQRAARPYPPADVRLNGEAYPTSVAGDVEVTASHRDRIAQADQLVDQTVGDVGPEAGTTYVVRNVDTDTDAETYYADGITAFPHVVPSGDLAASNRLEIYSVRDGLESWQRVVVEFSTGTVLLMEDGSPILTEDGDPIRLE